jgi:hypothetical protein
MDGKVKEGAEDLWQYEERPRKRKKSNNNLEG